MSAKEEQPKQEEKEEQVVEQQVEAEVGEESSEKPRLTREEHFEQQKEIDSRSIYVGNVDYSSTPEELEKFFNVAGVINRITILYDKYTGRPKGFAYVEFANKESVEGALKMNESEFKGRKLNVSEKRTNVPGFSRRGGFRGRGNFRGRGGFRGNYRGRGGFRGRGNYRARGGHRGFSSKSEESTVTDGEQEQAAPAKEVKKDSEATAESSS